MSYRTSLEKLRALEPKRLARMTYKNANGCCAIGAIAPSTHGCTSVIQAACRDFPAIAAEIQQLGLSQREARELQSANDECYGDDERRYWRVIEFLETEVAKEPS